MKKEAGNGRFKKTCNIVVYQVLLLVWCLVHIYLSNACKMAAVEAGSVDKAVASNIRGLQFESSP